MFLIAIVVILFIAKVVYWGVKFVAQGRANFDYARHKQEYDAAFEASLKERYGDSKY